MVVVIAFKMKFNVDALLDVLEPLSGPRLAPYVLALLAYIAKPGEVGDALWQVRHGKSVFHGHAISVRQRITDLVRTLYEALTSNTPLRLWTIVSLIRIVNRIGARLVIDRAAPRPIVWSSHVVVITGGARGIGGRVCELLSAKGAKVCVIDRAAESQHKKEDLFISADVTNEQDMQAARKQVHQELGYATILVSAAGIARHSFVLDPPHRFPSQFSNDVVDINLKGSLVFTRVFGQDLLPEYDEDKDVQSVKQGKATVQVAPRKEGSFPLKNNWGGHILLIGSGAAFVPLPANATYNSSKAGIVSLHHTLNFELDTFHKSSKVRNSVFCPLMIHSDMTKGRMLEQKNQFLFPTLTVDQAAEKIVHVLEEDRSQVFFLPRATYILSMLTPNAPPWIVRLIAKATGAQHTFSQYCETTRLAVKEH